MKAFVEHLSGVIRVGPDCDSYGKPYDYAVAFSSTDGKVAVLKGLVSDGRKASPSHLKAIVKALKALGLEAKWHRVKDA